MRKETALTAAAAPLEAPQTGPSPMEDNVPKRTIGFLGAFTIVAGSMVGVGIFLYPSHMASELPSLWALISVFIVGGLFALAGSVACGELGAMMPESGGDYVFQRAAMGPSVAFASGWVLYTAIFAGSNASLAVAVFQYQLSSLLGLDLTAMGLLGLSYAQWGAILLILGFTYLNDLGARVSSRTQMVLTLLPMGTLFLGALGVLFFMPSVEMPPAEAADPPSLSMSGLMTAFLYANFIFSGWINIIYVAAEVKKPERNIPGSMMAASLAVTLLYVVLVLAFVSVLGYAGLAELSLTWTDAGTGVARAMGSGTLEKLILLVIAVAILTSINATVLAGGRVGYAMAKDGAFLPLVGKLHPKRNTPSLSLWFAAGVAVLLIATGTFEAITKMTSVAMLVTGILTVFSLFVLRWRRPKAVRPYRAMGYPFFPALYILLALLAMVLTILDASKEQTIESWYPLMGLGVLLLTGGGHFIYHSLKKGRAS